MYFILLYSSVWLLASLMLSKWIFTFQHTKVNSVSSMAFRTNSRTFVDKSTTQSKVSALKEKLSYDSYEHCIYVCGVYRHIYAIYYIADIRTSIHFAQTKTKRISTEQRTNMHLWTAQRNNGKVFTSHRHRAYRRHSYSHASANNNNNNAEPGQRQCAPENWLGLGAAELRAADSGKLANSKVINLGGLLVHLIL